MKRRAFFQILAGAAIAPVLPKIALAMPAPFLWGDGIHDDSAALQALIDGAVVEFSEHVTPRGGWVAENVLQVPGGRFYLAEPLQLTRSITLDGGLCAELIADKTVLHVPEGVNGMRITIARFVIRTKAQNHNTTYALDIHDQPKSYRDTFGT
jgi:hypothetical protein